jgi:ketosteroid isomerase-like protein
MATRRAIDEAEIRRRLDSLAGAIRAMDLAAVMPMYASDMVSFDIGPPLRYVGAETKRRHWVEAFAAYQPPLGYELHELTLTVGDDVAVAHSVNRVSGTLKNGHRSDFWLRWTAAFRKIDGSWLIAHDHVSVPVDLGGEKALLDLTP